MSYALSLMVELGNKTMVGGIENARVMQKQQRKREGQVREKLVRSREERRERVGRQTKQGCLLQCAANYSIQLYQIHHILHVHLIIFSHMRLQLATTSINKIQGEIPHTYCITIPYSHPTDHPI